MSFLGRVFTGEQRQVSTLASPSRALEIALGATDGGSVDVGRSMNLSTVYACAALISGKMRGVPLKIYRESGGTIDLAPKRSPLWTLLSDQANTQEGFSAAELWSMAACSLMLDNNFFALKERMDIGGTQGPVSGLWPLDFRSVKVGAEIDGQGRKRAVYEITDGNGKTYTTGSQDILHIRGLSLPGHLRGISLVSALKAELGIALTQQDFQQRFLTNNARPSGFISTDRPLSPEARQNLKESWAAGFSRAENAGKTPILEEGMQYQQMGLTMADAEFLSQNEMSEQRICRATLVPPSMVNVRTGSTSLTYNNPAYQNRNLVDNCLMIYANYIESGLRGDSDIKARDNKAFARFDFSELLRADDKTRADTDSIDVAAGIKTRNEVRRDRNLPPIEGGDDLPNPETAPTEEPNGN